MDRKYKIEFTQYNEQNIQVISNCNAITFINNSLTYPITINNILDIPVGGSIAIEGNENEIDTTTYNVVVKESCIVLRKLYV
jgi:Na+-transporting NADH:ubiquinone oxidoreductase subunit NqrF